ncbi:MAG: hypothetical protein DHS20C18_23060 [Saprospiraceae bacterium]|nr:MAG: hypothetical protein DHS20C18_23060 [Saprospiraceae bacterium]
MLLGSNLPHMMKNDPAYFEEGSGLEAEALVIHFLPDFLAAAIKNIPEFSILDRLLKRSGQGILFSGNKHKKEVATLMKQMLEGDDFSRVLNFLALLKILAEEKDYQFISSQGYVNSLSYSNSRLDKVYEYVMNNFDDPSITLDHVAEIAHMNKSSFCRYFKKITQKTFSSFLNEIRVGYSCKILLEQDKKNISEISYLSGFNNISNFNRQFKMMVGMSPIKYKKLYQN